MRKILFFLSVFNVLIFGQPGGKNIYTDVIFLPHGTLIHCIITYRISYDQLVFTKKNAGFFANFRITAEVLDSTDKSILREIKEESLTLNSYELTTREDLFIQGYAELDLPSISFKIKPVYTDINSGYEQNLKEFSFDKSKFNSLTVFKPIVIKDNKQNTDTTAIWDLVNYNGDIPFSSDDISLVIVSSNPKDDLLDVELDNNDSTLIRQKIQKSFTGNLSVENSNGILKFVLNNKDKNSSIFILRDVNVKAHEGSVELKVKSGKDSISFENRVEWFLKPRTLQNEEYARKILTYIADESEIRKIKSASTQGDYSSFFEFWKKYDPTPGTTFNELMNEYYSRADYAVINYSVLGKTNGAETDRGKINILYGKPDDINRIYISSNDITEVWTYILPKNKFIFRDKTGTGNFILESHQ